MRPTEPNRCASPDQTRTLRPPARARRLWRRLRGRRRGAQVDQAGPATPSRCCATSATAGACGCEENTGDGAGILLQIPDAFLRKVTATLGFTLPPAGAVRRRRGVPADRRRARAPRARRCVERAVAEAGQTVLGWRDVPTDNSMLGATAVRSQPVIRQLFVARGRRRRHGERRAPPSSAGCTWSGAWPRTWCAVGRSAPVAAQKDLFYVCSLSWKTMVYKGMLTAEQLDAFFPDLNDPAMESALAIVHSRFSTNTFPSWARAHPYRTIAHNGEINTLRGNVNWMSARESQLELAAVRRRTSSKIKPVIDQTGSDSAMLDNVLELLVPGRPRAAARGDDDGARAVDQARVHERRSARPSTSTTRCLMEPWDGPAAICFTDGVQIGTVLDRNGLRPLRYYVTKDDLVVMASEAGVLPDIPPEKVANKGRIQPGRMFLVDTAQKRIISDEEIKDRYASQHPYGQWLQDNMVRTSDLPAGAAAIEPDHETLEIRQEAFGYTAEDLGKLVQPMAETGAEADRLDGHRHAAGGAVEPAAAAVQLLQAALRPGDQPAGRRHPRGDHHGGRDHHRSRAQPVRSHSPSRPARSSCGRRCCSTRSWSSCAPWTARPPARGFKTVTLPMLYPVAEDGAGLERALDELCRKASEALRDGQQHHHPVGPRTTAASWRPSRRCWPAAAVHHHLLREGTRTRVGLVRRERRAARGAPLLPADRLRRQRHQPLPGVRDHRRHGAPDGVLKGADKSKLKKNYTKAVSKGIVKVLSKMGISTVQSYHGAQVFEAIGLRPGRHRPLLHRDLVARRRHRPRRHRRGGAPAPRARLPQPAGGAAGPGAGRAVPVPQRRRVPPVQPRDHPQAAGRLPHRATTRPSSSTPAWSTISRATWPPCAG